MSKSFTFEASVKRLDAIVAKLESGDVPLEQALKLFQEGTGLVRSCSKLLDEAEHLEYTGVSNRRILENLYFLDGIGAEIILRCPVIPDVNLNEKHFDAIAELAGNLKNVSQIHLEPYHPLGVSKAEQLARGQGYQNREFLQSGDVEPFAEQLRKKTPIEVMIV